jgi:hypothetical protein
MPDDIATILQEALHRPVGSTVGDLGSFLSPWVAGIEATQAIQYYKSAEHLTDPGDRAPDNSATLAAYKPLMVRAYVNAPRRQHGLGHPHGRAGAMEGMALRLRRRRHIHPLARCNHHPERHVCR